MKNPLTLNRLSELVGKTISWTAESHSSNAPYRGVEKIVAIDLKARRPIVKTEIIDKPADSITFAFVEDHTLEAIPEGWKAVDGDGENNCLSYSDSYREVFYSIVDEN